MRDDARADVLGELDGVARDAAGAALDQDRLAALELERVLDRVQRGQADQRQRRGVHVRQAVGLLRDDRGLDRDLLGVGALLARRQHAEHRIADLEVGDALAQRADGAGEIPPQHIGKLQRGIVAACAPSSRRR